VNQRIVGQDVAPSLLSSDRGHRPRAAPGLAARLFSATGTRAMSHDLSFLLWLPRHALALTLAALLTLATQPASAAAPPPNPELSKAERAEVEAAACGSDGCLKPDGRDICLEGDPRVQLFGLFSGYFDGGTTLEAFASVLPCHQDSLSGMVGAMTVLLRRDGNKWRRNDVQQGIPVNVTQQCRVVRDGDRDVLLCWSGFASGGSCGTDICSLSRENGTRFSCPLSIARDRGPEICTFGSSQTAEVTGVAFSGRPGSALIMEVRITINKKLFSTKGLTASEAEDACQRAYDRDNHYLSRHDSDFRQEKYVVRIPVLHHRLKLTAGIARQIKRMKTDTILLE
jgi:hypothetical protein